MPSSKTDNTQGKPSPQVEEFVERVRSILALCSRDGHHVKTFQQLDAGELAGFLMATNPRFPYDTLQPIDAACMHVHSMSYPSAYEVDILEQAWRDAIGCSGDLRWELTPRRLKMSFSPKHSGAYYTVEYAAARRSDCLHRLYLLSFPLDVSCTAYADMDDPSNHSPYCYMSDDPFEVADNDDEPSGDCCCETFPVHTMSRTFDEPAKIEDKLYDLFVEAINH